MANSIKPPASAEQRTSSTLSEFFWRTIYALKYREGAQNKLSFPEKNKVGAEIARGIDLGLGNASFNKSLFENHVDKKSNDYTAFKDVKNSNNDTLVTVLNSQTVPESKAASDAIKKMLNTVFEQSKEFKEAQEQFKSKAATFDELRKNAARDKASQKVMDFLSQTITDAKAAIVAQQKLETQQLERQLSHPDFTKNLTTVLGHSEAEQKKIRSSFTQNLESMHKQQLADFENSATTTLNDIHKESSIEVDRLISIGTLYKHGDKNFRRHVEELANKNKKPDSELTVIVAEDKKDKNKETIDFTSIKFQDLEFLQLASGNKIKKSEQENPAKYTLNFGSRILNPLYYLKNRDRADFNVLAMAVKLSGCDTITMKLDFSNPEIAKERARDAFRACIKQGFAPDKIILNVNGTLMKYQEVEKATDKEPACKSIQKELFSADEFQDLEKLSKKFIENDKRLTQSYTNTDPEQSSKRIKSSLSESKTPIAASVKVDPGSEETKRPGMS